MAGVQRCIAAGRFTSGEATELARQLWALTHGAVTLQLAELITPQQARQCIGDTALKLFTTYGDDSEVAAQSLLHGLKRSRVEGTPPRADRS